MSRTPTWFSVTVEALDGDQWRMIDRPGTEVAEDEEELAEYKATSYDLAELGRPWRVRVFAGYNRYDELVAELSG